MRGRCRNSGLRVHPLEPVQSVQTSPLELKSGFGSKTRVSDDTANFLELLF